MIISTLRSSHGRRYHCCISDAESIRYGRPLLFSLSHVCLTVNASSTVSGQDHCQSFFTVLENPVIPVDSLSPKKPGTYLVKPLKPLLQGNKMHVDLINTSITHDRSAAINNGKSEMYGCCAQPALNKIQQPPNQASWSKLFKDYRANGNLMGARSVFNLMPAKDVVVWTCMMSAYTEHKQGKEALELFYQMHNEGMIIPDICNYACALNACTIAGTLEDGRIIHSAIVNASDILYMVVETALIGLYGKCGCISDAKEVFEGLQYKDAVCWNTMITVLVQNDHETEALLLFRQMHCEGIEPNSMTYVYVLHACTNTSTLKEGQLIHTTILGAGCEHYKVLNTALINMYTRCGSVSHAMRVFSRLSYHDNISWTAMIASFSRHGYFRDALLCFFHMQNECIIPDNITLVCIVDACAGLKDAKDGLLVHAAVIDSDHAEDGMLGNALLNMYIKCGYIHDAWRIFDRLSAHNDLSWNIMFGALSDHGYHKEILCFFLQVVQRDLEPNDSSYACIINACTKLMAFEQGNLLHAAILESGDDGQLVIVSALINMYGKNGRAQDARKVFEMTPSYDVVCWNAMMTTLVQTGDFRDALNRFYKMEYMGIKPSNISFLCALDACNGLISLEDGQKIHGAIAKRGRIHDIMVASALINMYGKCGSLSEAKKLFENIPRKDAISCTSMVVALTENQLHEEALNQFSDMVCNGINPDTITFVCILNACACLTAVEVGFIIHAAVVEMELEQDTLIGTGIMDVYGKGGTIEDASKVFSTLSNCDIGTWNAMLSVYAHNGNENEIKGLFKQFEMNMAKPNCTTFISMLVAFDHSGMVDDGWYFFHYMRNKYGFLPESEHYVCMVDLLGRAGQLNEAKDLISYMPFQRVSLACRSMFSACIMHGNLEYGEHISKFCFESNGNTDSPYVMLSNMYAILGRADDELNLISITEERNGHEHLLHT